MHYALANLLDGALAVKGLGTYASISRARGMQLNDRKNKIYRNYVTLNGMHEEPALVRLGRFLRQLADERNICIKKFKCLWRDF